LRNLPSFFKEGIKGRLMPVIGRIEEFIQINPSVLRTAPLKQGEQDKVHRGVSLGTILPTFSRRGSSGGLYQTIWKN
jgi:hypothetical protein